MTQADKAHVCVRLLSLSDAMGPSSEQVATQEELVHAATALSQAAPLPGPLADLRLQNGDMDALRMLWAQVLPCYFLDRTSSASAVRSAVPAIYTADAALQVCFQSGPSM